MLKLIFFLVSVQKDKGCGKKLENNVFGNLNFLPVTKF